MHIYYLDGLLILIILVWQFPIDLFHFIAGRTLDIPPISPQRLSAEEYSISTFLQTNSLLKMITQTVLQVVEGQPDQVYLLEKKNENLNSIHILYSLLYAHLR